MEEDGESTEKQGVEVMGNTEENAHADTKACVRLWGS
jgi:hypothetical protein